jgi:hypothetical protein
MDMRMVPPKLRGRGPRFRGAVRCTLSRAGSRFVGDSACNFAV